MSRWGAQVQSKGSSKVEGHTEVKGHAKVCLTEEDWAEMSGNRG